MENIKLITINNNEDSSSMGIATNKNMKTLETYINFLLENQNTNTGSSLNRVKMIIKTNEDFVENDFYRVEKTTTNGITRFTVTPIDGEINMELVISEIRTFSNEKIICPVKYTENNIVFEIDNIDDVVMTNPTNPNNDTNNKIIILI